MGTVPGGRRGSRALPSRFSLELAAKFMARKPAHAISPTRGENYPEWYQEVIKAADLAEVSPVRGCMVIKPWGYTLWENMQRVLDGMFKAGGHENAYFPLFIPLSFLEKEAEHVEGFAKECAVVTHHRLQPGPEGGLVPSAPLEEPLVVRPTSETIIGAMYAKWIQSYRDLPILINQWANVVRWEMRTRLFLRTTEFLWQEGHTAHATEAEAMEETMDILRVYTEFAEQYMAMPVVQGEKTADERFPGAVSTYSIEAMMQDRKALQAGTSHFLGQNFSRAQGITFQDQHGKEVHAWTTSWGVSTRLVGALIMTHSDDDGLVLPPRLAPRQVVVLPIYRNDEERDQVLPYCRQLVAELTAQPYVGEPLRVLLDDRDLRGGEKTWQHIKRGVPVRLEIGPRDVAAQAVFLGRRDTKEKRSVPRSEIVATIGNILTEIQDHLLQRARDFRQQHSREISSLDEFREFFAAASDGQVCGGFAYCPWTEDPAVSRILADLKVTIRCVPVDQEPAPGECLFTGRPTRTRALFAAAY
jgi:prolyl-tRNA synthetase